MLDILYMHVTHFVITGGGCLEDLALLNIYCSNHCNVSAVYILNS